MKLRTDMDTKPMALSAMVCRDFGDFGTVIDMQPHPAREQRGGSEQS